MTNFTITTWNNIYHASADTFGAALVLARDLAAADPRGFVARIRDTEGQEVLAVHPDGSLGTHWQNDAPFSADDGED